MNESIYDVHLLQPFFDIYPDFQLQGKSSLKSRMTVAKIHLADKFSQLNAYNVFVNSFYVPSMPAILQPFSPCVTNARFAHEHTMNFTVTFQLVCHPIIEQFSVGLDQIRDEVKKLPKMFQYRFIPWLQISQAMIFSL